MMRRRREEEDSFLTYEERFFCAACSAFVLERFIYPFAKMLSFD
jgi:hypothetical protein